MGTSPVTTGADSNNRDLARLEVTLAPNVTVPEAQEIADALDNIHFAISGQHMREFRAVINGEAVDLTPTHLRPDKGEEV